MLLLGFMTAEQYVAAVRIPDYFGDARYTGNWAWAKANEPRYGNESAWIESGPTGYKEADIMHDSVIAAQAAQLNLNRVYEPFLVETESNIPDYWNDERYDPNWTWAKANEPRYGNETAWVESAPTGYKEANIFDASVIADQEAQWGQQNTFQPFLAQIEPRRQFPIHFAQKQGPYEKNSENQDTGKVNPEYLRFVRPEDYHNDSPDGHNHDGELDYDHDGDYEIPDTLKDRIKAENIANGTEWAGHSEHGKPTFPFETDEARELNFPGSIVNETGSSLDEKLQNLNSTDNRVNVFLRHFPGEVFKSGDGFVKVLTGDLARNDRTEHGAHYPDHNPSADPMYSPVYGDADNNGIPDDQESDDSDSSDDSSDGGDGAEEEEQADTTGGQEEEEQADAGGEEEEEQDDEDYYYEECAEGDVECEANAETIVEEDAAADEETAQAAVLAKRRNGDIYAHNVHRFHERPSLHKVPKPQLKPLFAAKDHPSANQKDAVPKGFSTAQLSNQERLYRQMHARTYPEWDSDSYISPYSQRDHAWTGDQYDVYNETHWVDTSAVDGYKIPITADDGDQFFVQKERRTYPEWDSDSYISPYSQRDHAWTGDQYDVYNETHWVDASDETGYKIPITADDGNSFIQRTRRTYPEPDSDSYITPYFQRDHAWTGNQYDMSNETHWVDASAEDGYKIPITADDADQFFFAQQEEEQVGEPHPYREHAWTDEQHWASHEPDWTADAPEGYRIPITGTHGFSQQRPVSMAEALAKYFRVETNSTILPYIVRDHAWNLDQHDMSGSFFRYRDDAPDGYHEHLDYICPHPTNYPNGQVDCGQEVQDEEEEDEDQLDATPTTTTGEEEEEQTTTTEEEEEQTGTTSVEEEEEQASTTEEEEEQTTATEEEEQATEEEEEQVALAKKSNKNSKSVKAAKPAQKKKPAVAKKTHKKKVHKPKNKRWMTDPAFAKKNESKPAPKPIATALQEIQRKMGNSKAVQQSAAPAKCDDPDCWHDVPGYGANPPTHAQTVAPSAAPIKK